MQAQPEPQAALAGDYSKAFGMDVPLWKQYLNFWNGPRHGDLGTSIWQFPARAARPGDRAQLPRTAH